MMGRFRLSRLLLIIAAVMAGAVAFVAAGRAQEDQGVLAGFISQILSTPASRVSVGAVEGALSSNATIRNVTVADRDGVYLRIDVIRFAWRRTALLSRRLEIQNLEIGKFELARRAAPGDASAPSSGPILPELPLKVQVDKFALNELSLGEPILGVAARFSATGNASLGPPAEGLRATLDVKRLDAPGQTALRLGFTPANEQLDLSIQHDEPAGGVAARLMNLPGLPPVKLDVLGAGRLDDWGARLMFDAGAGIDARGEARLARAGALRRLGLNLNAHVENLLPPAVAAVFAGDVTLTGGATFGDDGAVGVENIRLASQLAELTIAGRLSADRMLDVAAKARALPNEGGATRRGDATLAHLVFDGSVKGPLNAPAVDGQLDLRGLSTPAVKAAALAATFTIQPIRDASAPRYRLIADAKLNGFSLADRGLSEAIGDNATLIVRGVIDDKSIADLTEARIASPNLAFSFTGLAGSTLVNGQARSEITNLAALSTLAGRALAGRAALRVALQGDPSKSAINAALEGDAADLSLNDPVADRLIDRRLSFSGRVRTEPGAAMLEKVAARGRFIAAEFNGRLAGQDLALDGDLSLTDLSKLDARLAGAARIAARATGAASDPSIAIRANADAIRALDKPIRGLNLTIDAARLISAPAIALAAQGDVNGKPLTADIKAVGGADGWVLNALAARIGSVAANGQGRYSADGLVTGRLSVSATDLGDLSPLVLTPMRGSLDATLDADAPNGRQRVAVDANGRRIVAGAATLETLKAALRADDLFGRVTVNGEASVDRLVAGGENVERIALTARGGADASDLSLTARARGFDLAAGGRLFASAPLRFDLSSFTATRAGARIALASPTSLVLEDGGARTERLAINVQGGEIALRGKAGANLDLSIEAKRLPLAALDIFSPGTGLRGVVDARATLKGPAAQPRGPFEATIKDLSAPQTRAMNLPALDVAARGEARGDRASVNARINGGRAIAIEIDGAAPLNAAGAFDLRARGNLDAALANAMLAGGGQRVAGRIAIEGALRGTRARPDIQGVATLSGGSFSDPLQGVALNNIEGRASGRGDSIVIERITARAKNGGAIAVAGRVVANADRGFPADLKITATNAELVSSDLATLVANVDLTASGPLATTPRLSGRVDIANLDVRVPDRLPSASEPLRDARHIAPPRQTRARLAQTARQRAAAQKRKAAAFNAALDLVISAPGRVFVRGRGIDAELGGDLRLAGTTTAPQAIGGFEMRRGRLSILTQRLDFTRGRITFAGDLIPDLDFVAETRAGDVTARVGVTGRASEPTFALSSTPDLPQDEVLSRLLFARAAGGLSPFQAVQLAQAAAQLAGAGGGPDVFEKTRRALGVDDLDVGMGDGGPTVGVSRAINDRLRIGVKTGAKPESSAIGADIDLTRRLKIQTEIGADGRAAVGIGAELEY